MSDAQAIAERSAAAMWERDIATRGLGTELVSVGPGRALMTMTVRPDMSNGHGSCHGGYIFALADSAFAFACNSYDINAVAAGCSIEYLRPAHPGEKLTAEAVEQSRSGRLGVYDIRVTNPAGEIVALFRGKSMLIRGSVTGTERGLRSGDDAR